jgi:hypothetical protein
MNNQLEGMDSSKDLVKTKEKIMHHDTVSGTWGARSRSYLPRHEKSTFEQESTVESALQATALCDFLS